MAETLIHEGCQSQVFLVDGDNGSAAHIRKTLTDENPPVSWIAQLQNEFDIINSLPASCTRQALRIGRHQRRQSLFLEYINQPSLAVAFRGKQHDIEDFLYIAIATAAALSDIHSFDIIHKDISSANILVDIQNRSVKIIDFGASTRISLKEPKLGNPERLEGTLAYISPEQTGRMNRAVDYRTDLYSMGAVFYEMLATVPPFEADDAMQIVHAHIAQQPQPLHERAAHVPTAISAIVSKLLEKNAEDRYQSAAGVAHDLRYCLQQLTQTGQIPPFRIARNDYSGRFQIPEKLYGREAEISTLMSAFDAVSNGGRKLVMVAGYSGTGKSALVREIHKPVTANRGYFVEGKFDQFQRSVPYFAVLKALRSYVALRLTESTEQLNELRQRVLAAVGRDGRVLTNVIPDLIHVIGTQPEIPEVGGVEAQNRFNYAFSGFMRAIATAEQPLVLFIDDLQWADAASLNLLKLVMTDHECRYLLCIGAYRDNEVSPSHPAMIAMREIAEAGADIETIRINSLAQNDVTQLIAEATASDTATVATLADLVFSKTAGNAFFVNQFMTSLYEDNLLAYDKKRHEWQWNVPQINARKITDNVVELMAGKIRKLPETTRETLKMAACIGSSFDLDTLAIILGQPVSQVLADLHVALAEGLLVSIEDNYKFTHDRIQQAVYSLIPSAEKSGVHLSIGRLLIERLTLEEQASEIFEITNHWNIGAEDLDLPGDSLRLAELNLLAGKRAKQSSAFVPASDYLNSGIALLPDNHWQNQYPLALDLFTLSAEVAYLNGDFELMDSRLEEVLENARELLDKVLPWEIRILAFKARNRLNEAISTGLNVLQELGEDFPRQANAGHVVIDLVKTRGALRGKSTELLAQLPDMTDPRKIAAMRIIAGIASSSYWATPQLFPLLIFRMCRMSLRDGNTSLSAFGFATYGVILCGVLGAMKSGYEFGKLGLILLERFDERAWLTQVYCPVYALINIWTDHVETTLEPLQNSYHVGLETGAIEFACINANIYCIAAYLSGRPLERTERETRLYSEAFDHHKQETNYNYNQVYHQAMLNFMDRAADPLILTGTAYDEARMMQQNLQRNDQTGTFFIHFNKLILCYHFGDFAQARVHAAECRERLEAVLAKLEIPNHHFYEALTLLALYPNADAATKVATQARVVSNLRKLRKWANDAPDNYRHKYLLVQAEWLRTNGRANAARPVYDQAIQSANTNRYLHEEALACEVAARFYIEQTSASQAEFHMRTAYDTYAQWGAEAKLKQLAEQYPQYIAISRPDGTKSAQTSTIKPSANPASTSNSSASSLDLITLNKAANAIAREIKLKQLLELLMEIAVENAGARSGYLLLNDNGQLLIQAEYDLDNDYKQVLQAEPARNNKSIAATVVQYVQRTRESVVLADARSDMNYASDPSILLRQPRSLLCTAIINQGRLVGLLYLENNLNTGVFNYKLLEMVNILAGQFTVSLDNAMLYENLERKVHERTEALNQEKTKSEQLLLNILPAETADELKHHGRAKPNSYEAVTIMFTDFTAFTKVSEVLSANDLVAEVDACFSAFDEITQRHRVEKIKTIGDAYMCVGGLPIANSTHARDVVRAALDIRDWVADRKLQREAAGLPGFDVRIGINTGPVVAGVVGTHKFAYDIWGKAVNTAARVEQGSEPGMVNISGSTYALIKDQFACSYRGKLPAKNMADIDMYFVGDPGSPRPVMNSQD